MYVLWDQPALSSFFQPLQFFLFFIFLFLSESDISI